MHTFDRRHKPVLVRSAHKKEGSPHPFSGLFNSFKGITSITPTDTEILDPQSDAYWEHGPKPESIASAYDLIVSGASEGLEVRQYVEAHGITDYSPFDMNAIVMDEIGLEVFGMFLTSNQDNPDEVLIHYQTIDDEAKKMAAAHYHYSQAGTGGVVIYNKKTKTLDTKEIDTKLVAVLKDFGETASRIESIFGDRKSVV